MEQGPPKHTYRLTIAYDGTDFSGWQVQPNGVSIQQLIEEALHTILRHPIRIIGSGRTDAGVHAIGQVAHFKVEDQIDLHRLLGSLNGLLPATIRIMKTEEAQEGFHAQYSAKGKIYHYHLTLGKIANPFTRLYSWQVFEPLDIALLEAGGRVLIGTHDFTSFANEAHEGSAANDAVRTLKRIDVIQEELGVRLEFEGDGFLYKMVRNLVGTLVEVAKGKRAVADIMRILTAKDRRQAGQAAPPQGLFLVKVLYPPAQEVLQGSQSE